MDSINIDRTDLVLQYIAAIAGQETGWDGELGMIHFIKYVYLLYSREVDKATGVMYDQTVALTGFYSKNDYKDKITNSHIQLNLFES